MLPILLVFVLLAVSVGIALAADLDRSSSPGNGYKRTQNQTIDGRVSSVPPSTGC